MRRSLLLFTLLFILMTTLDVHAIGLAPASSDYWGNPGDTVIFRMKILNPGGGPVNVSLSPEGPLAPHIVFDKDRISLDGEESWVTGRISLPAGLPAGETQSYILVTTDPGAGGMINARLQIAHTVHFHVEYEEPYLWTEWLQGGLNPGQPSHFRFLLRNLGPGTILGIDVQGKVMDMGDGAEDAIIAGPFDVPGEEGIRVDVAWKSPLAGAYAFNGTVGSGSHERTFFRTFDVGKPSISLEWVESESVPLGEIMPVGIGVSSNWNLPLRNVFVMGRISQSDETLIETKSTSEVLERGEPAQLDIFMETEKLDYGEYVLDMEIRSDLSSDTYRFGLEITERGMSLTPTGFSVRTHVKPFGQTDQAFTGLIFVGLAIVLSIISAILMLRRSRK